MVCKWRLREGLCFPQPGQALHGWVMLFTACHSYHQIFTSTFNIKQALQKHLMTGLLLRTTSQSRAIPAKIKSGLAVYRVAASPVSNPTGVGMQALLNDIRCGLIKGYLGIPVELCGPT